MRYSYLFFSYIKWHYSHALVSLWRIAGNLSWAFYHMFSLPLLIHTLWKPWHKLSETGRKSFKLEDMFGNMVVSILMRLIGFCLRIFTITLGVVFIIGMYVVGVLFTIFWLIAPLVALLSLLVGIRIII